MAQVLGGKRANLSSRLLCSHPKIVLSLKVHPEFRRVPKPVGEPQRGIPCDTALARDDLGDAVGRHVKLPGQLGRCYAEGLQLVRQDFSRVMGRSSHWVP